MATARDHWPVVLIVAVVFFAWLTQPHLRLWYGPGSEPQLMTFEANDAAMNRAMQQARATAETFIKALAAPGPTESNFAIKAGFRDGAATEYVWLDNVRYNDNTFFATVGNTPEKVRSIRYGMPVKVQRDAIADWMFIRSRKLVGGWTIWVMRSRLSPEDRAALDANTGFQFDEAQHDMMQHDP